MENKPPAPKREIDSRPPESHEEITAEAMEDIITRARQVVKPIINREAAAEIVSDDILNFRMKVSAGRGD